MSNNMTLKERYNSALKILYSLNSQYDIVQLYGEGALTKYKNILSELEGIFREGGGIIKGDKLGEIEHVLPSNFHPVLPQILLRISDVYSKIGQVHIDDFLVIGNDGKMRIKDFGEYFPWFLQGYKIFKYSIQRNPESSSYDEKINWFLNLLLPNIIYFYDKQHDKNTWRYKIPIEAFADIIAYLYIIRQHEILSKLTVLFNFSYSKALYDNLKQHHGHKAHNNFIQERQRQIDEALTIFEKTEFLVEQLDENKYNRMPENIYNIYKIYNAMLSLVRSIAELAINEENLDKNLKQRLERVLPEETD